MDFLSILRAICLEHKLFLALAVSLLTLSSLMEASALFGLAPMVDLLIHPDLSQASSITLKIVEGIKSVGLPATVITVMLSYIAVLILKNLLSAAAQPSQR